MRPTWVRTKPTLPGYYWLRNITKKVPEQETVVDVRECRENGLTVWSMNPATKRWMWFNPVKIISKQCEWAGPIESPLNEDN